MGSATVLDSILDGVRADVAAREAVEACDLPTTWLPSWHNLGGAGGFAVRPRATT